MDKEFKGNILYAVLLLSILPIFYFWITQSSSLLFQGSGNLFVSLSRITALLAVFFILLQLILVGRLSWVEKTFGHDKLSVMHHFSGIIAGIFIIAHPILILFGYSMNGKTTFLSEFFSLIKGDEIIGAVISVILFVAIVFTSIYFVKKKIKYEYWFLIHLFTYLAILLAWGHQLELGGDFGNRIFVGYWYFLYIFSIGNLLIFRFAVPMYSYNKNKFFISKIIKESKEVFSVYIKGNHISEMRIEPGQFMNFRFMKKGFWLQSHPFSISKIDKKRNEIRVTIKNLGDFTSKIGELKKGTMVVIEGPYGVFTESSSRKGKFLFLAAGIGITPIKALVESLSEKKKDLFVLYSARKKKDLIFKKEFGKLSKTRIHYFVTSDSSWKGDKRRINLEVIKEYVKDIEKRDIYICGPKNFIDSLVKDLKNEGISEEQIHFERFSVG